MDHYFIKYCQSLTARSILDGHIPQIGDYFANNDDVFVWDGKRSLVGSVWIPDLDILMVMICAELSPNRGIPVKWGTALLKLSIWMTEQNAVSLFASCMQDVLLRYLVSLRQHAVEHSPKQLTEKRA